MRTNPNIIVGNLNQFEREVRKLDKENARHADYVRKFDEIIDFLAEHRCWETAAFLKSPEVYRGNLADRIGEAAVMLAEKYAEKVAA